MPADAVETYYDFTRQPIRAALGIFHAPRAWVIIHVHTAPLYQLLALRSLNTSVSSVNGVAGLSRSPRARSNRGGGHTRLSRRVAHFLMWLSAPPVHAPNTNTRDSALRAGGPGTQPTLPGGKSRVSFRTRNPSGCDARGAWYGKAPARNIRSSCLAHSVVSFLWQMLQSNHRARDKLAIVDLSLNIATNINICCAPSCFVLRSTVRYHRHTNHVVPHREAQRLVPHSKASQHENE